MTVASTPRRALSALVGLLLVACGILGTRHEAHVAHVVDRATGAIVHAAELSSEHAAPQTDLHAEHDSSGDHDACELATALHQPIRAASAPPLHVAPDAHAIAVAAPRVESIDVFVPVYRLAPKTSPPARS